jgi:hypothetical protein
MSGAHRNRAGRRSGGARPVEIHVGPVVGDTALLSIQCFEKRCGMCRGTLEPINPKMKCECRCHAARRAAQKEEGK